MNPVTIILPVYKGKEMTEKCLESIDKNTRYSYEIIIIEDEINNDDYLSYFLFSNVKTVITRKEKLGPISAYNLGMRIAKGNVLLTQNDVEFPDMIEDLKDNKGCWLTRLVNKSKEENIGMVGCLNSVNKIEQPIDFVGTWCMFIPRTTINKIGYFDESFGLAMMDDIDYSRRVIINGFKIDVEKSFEIRHESSATLKQLGKEKVEELKRNAAKIYEAKWADFKENMTKEEIKKYDYW